MYNICTPKISRTISIHSGAKRAHPSVANHLRHHTAAGHGHHFAAVMRLHPTHAHRIHTPQQIADTRPIGGRQFGRRESQHWRLFAFRLRMPHQHFGAIAGARFDVSQPQVDALEEFVLFVAGPIWHRCVRAACEEVEAHREASHIDGPLAFRRPRIVEADDATLIEIYISIKSW